MANVVAKTAVVILGGGFAGISLAKELAKLTKKDPAIEIHLVNQENYFVFQPMLPEVVSCAIEPGHILNPIRHLCPNVTVHQATISGINLETRKVALVGTDSRRPWELPYDHLVISLGLMMNLAVVPGMAEHALPLKTLGDAFHLRNHVLSRLEEADSEADQDLRKTILTFVTIGGGFSGVETMAAINDMVKTVLPFYPKAQDTGTRMLLIHSRENILNELEHGLAQFSQQKLQERGVECRLRTTVKEITPNGVLLSTGEQVPARTVICTVGNVPHPLMAQFPLPQERGRILVEATMQVKGSKNIWALGDAALVPDVTRGAWCPPTAQYAMRQGRQAARNILAVLHDRPPGNFQFKGIGQLAVIGRRCGVAQIWGWKISGFLAWVLWRSIYFMKLPGLRCKVRVALDWIMEIVFPRNITKVEVQRTEQLKRAHYQKGDCIIREGEIGDRFYIIESGEVEIVRQEPGGEREQQLALRSAGDSFGELALLKDAPRAATVRCVTPVDVIIFNRKDFLTLAGSYNIFRQHMDQEATAVAEFHSKKTANPQKP
jgi:NADH dehydrogenase